MKRLALIPALFVLASAGTASADTLTVHSGDAGVEATDGTTWFPALTVEKNQYWADPITDTSWISPYANRLGQPANTGYRVSLPLPAGSSATSLAVDTRADNDVAALLNGVSFGTDGAQSGLPCGTSYSPSVSPQHYSTNSGFTATGNTLSFVVGNCQANPEWATTPNDTGITFSATLTYCLTTNGGILQPINLTGPRSSFKTGSTIPVKIVALDCTGAPLGTLAPEVRLVKGNFAADPDGLTSEAASTVPPSNGITMRYDAGAGQYIYNLATKGLAPGDYTVSVSGAGSTSTALINLK
jgi:hypothetical protein